MDVEWLMDETAARGVVTMVAQETNDGLDAMYGSLDYAVRLATGVHKKILLDEPESSGAVAELRVVRPCRVVCGVPMNEPDELGACALLAMRLAEKIGASPELFRTNLSLRACRTEREFEKMIAHARKFRADAIVIIMPTHIEIDISELVERLEAVARSQNIAVVIVESFSTDVFNDLLSGWRLTDGACV
jgi:hypothetical protein